MLRLESLRRDARGNYICQEVFYQTAFSQSSFLALEMEKAAFCPEGL